MGIFDAVSDLFGGPDTQVNVPGKSPQDIQLQNMQLDALTKQGKMNDLLLPYQLKQLGLDVTMGPDGSISGVTENAAHKQQGDLQNQLMQLSLSQLQSEQANAPQSAEIQKLEGDRTLAALKGELPVDPALTRTLDEQGSTLNEQLRKQLGSGYETSDPGIRSLATFNQRKNETLESARRGDLSLADQLSQARSATQFGQGMSSSQLAQQLRGMNLGMLGTAQNSMSPFINNLNAPQQLGFQQQQLQTNANAASVNSGLALYNQNSDMFSNMAGVGLGKLFK